MKFRDYYEVLGVKRDAKQDEVTRAFRKLARKYHPDVSKDKGAEDKFKEINEAYEVLGDAEKRKRYDSLGANWQQGDEFRVPPEWGSQAFGGGQFARQGRAGGMRFEFGGPSGASGAAGFGGDFSDFFEAIFGGQGFDPRHFSQTAGADFSPREAQQADIQLSLEDVYRGASRTISLETVEIGSSGGPQRKVRSYDVTIPAGTTDGSLIRLAGQGSRSSTSGKAGDIMLKVAIAPHRRIRVQGFDLVTELAVTPWEAALGAQIAVQGVDKSVKVKVPPGSQSGTRLRLKGLGLRKSGGERGDMFAEIKVMVPARVTGTEKELFEKLAQVSSFNPRTYAGGQ